MELNYKVQTYAWGKKGRDSKVATLLANSDSKIKIDDDTPYAELWLGTHVNGPSSLKSGATLAELLEKHPEYLGESVRKVFGDQLPFLFKVLSVNKALSVQAHPTKTHAKELHKKWPDVYKDSNHKPELAIALTPFEAMCGFRPLSEILYFLKNIPELKAATNNVVDKYKKDCIEMVKDAFRAIFVNSKSVISKQLKKLLERFKTLDEKGRKQQYADLVERLYEQYPDDVGCFMIYFLNYLKLKPFEAIYLEPNLPHAYLFGDCIECMACSDNVVRAGLTPKFIDVETLCSMIIYEGGTAEQRIFTPAFEDNYTLVFKPPVPDFAVIQIKVPKSAKKYVVEKRNSASILLVIEGIAKMDKVHLHPGVAVFLPAEQHFTVDGISEDLLLYQSLANV